MVAITGANGLLGRFIVERFVEENIPVIAILRKGQSDKKNLQSSLITERYADVTDSISLSEALQGATCVIHTAALVSFNPRAFKKLYQVNVIGTKNIVDACLNLNIPRLIHISSVAALGRSKGVTSITEEIKWVSNDLNTNYAESKYLAELEVYRGFEEGLQVSVVSPSVILAPSNDNRSSARLFGFVWNENVFYTSGQFNYVDVRDLTEVISQLYKGNFNGQKYIANTGSVSFIDFFKQVAKRFGKKPPFINVHPVFIGLLSFFEAIRSRLTGSEPLIVKKLLKTNKDFYLFSNEKVKQILNIKFRTLEETLDWCCSEYLMGKNNQIR
jgi:dihydroflavonol-4-reductase